MTTSEFNVWAARFMARLEAARLKRRALSPAETIDAYEAAEQIPR